MYSTSLSLWWKVNMINSFTNKHLMIVIQARLPGWEWRVWLWLQLCHGLQRVSLLLKLRLRLWHWRDGLCQVREEVKPWSRKHGHVSLNPQASPPCNIFIILVFLSRRAWSGFVPKQYFRMDLFIKVAKKDLQVLKMNSIYRKKELFFMLCYNYKEEKLWAFATEIKTKVWTVNNESQQEYFLFNFFVFSQPADVSVFPASL